MKNLAYSLIGAATLALSAGTAHAVVIDSFQTGMTLDQATVGTSSASVNGAGILGGQREATLNVISNPNPATRNSEVTIGGGTLAYSNDIRVSSQLNLLYDGIDGNAGTNNFGLGGVDFTDAGTSDGFTVNYAADANTSLIFRMFEDAGNFSDFTLGLIGDNALNSARVTYSSFAIARGTGANTNSVNAFEIIANNGGAISSLDLEVNGLGQPPVSVNEAAFALPMMMGVLGFAAYARRRKSRA